MSVIDFGVLEIGCMTTLLFLSSMLLDLICINLDFELELNQIRIDLEAALILINYWFAKIEFNTCIKI